MAAGSPQSMTFGARGGADFRRDQTAEFARKSSREPDKALHNFAKRRLEFLQGPFPGNSSPLCGISMQSAAVTAKRPRAQHRHDLRTLTYVTLDESNGGIVRNLNQSGLAVQAVAPLRAGQFVRVRFELRSPRIVVQARGEVLWSEASGQMGIRFVDLPPRMVRQLNEWIFGDLLAVLPLHTSNAKNLFGAQAENRSERSGGEKSDGLLLSPTARKVIPLTGADSPKRISASSTLHEEAALAPVTVAKRETVSRTLDLDWLSRPLSGMTLILTVDALIVFAATLLFFLVFIAVSGEMPEWPINLALGAAIAIFVGSFYWGFFHTLGGTTMGASLARLAKSSDNAKDTEKMARFR